MGRTINVLWYYNPVDVCVIIGIEQGFLTLIIGLKVDIRQLSDKRVFLGYGIMRQTTLDTQHIYIQLYCMQ